MIDSAGPVSTVKHVLRRLNAACEITPAAERALSGAISIRPAVAGHMEVHVDSCVAFLLTGLACRVRLLADGRRQLTGFLVPGDLCDHGFLKSCKSTTKILTLVPSTVAEISMSAFLALCDDHPDVMRSLLRVTAVEGAVSEERIVSLGLRTSFERLGHLFCELHQRLATVGLVDHDSYDFHVTQAEIGDGLGMSAVHVNRTLQRLRRENFLSSRSGRIHILDEVGLRKMAGYDPEYLN